MAVRPLDRDTKSPLLTVSSPVRQLAGGGNIGVGDASVLTHTILDLEFKSKLIFLRLSSQNYIDP